MPGDLTAECTKVFMGLGFTFSRMAELWTALGVNAPEDAPALGIMGELGAGPNLAWKACWWARGG
jgi:hypothetical protein